MLNFWKPEAFHGRGKKKNFFEGWYFKLVDRSEKHAYAIIPGVSITADPLKSHAFIMFIDARANRMHYFRYPLDELKGSDKKFELTIGESSFSTEGIILNLSQSDLDKNNLDPDRIPDKIDQNILNKNDFNQNSFNHNNFNQGETQTALINGRIRFKDTYPWPVKLLSPGVMGWYAFVPGMECYHGILSMDHTLEGFIEIEGRKIDLSGGRGYLEKDWGASMPSSWIWMQTNHFDREGVSLSGSIAKIPWLGSYFTGYIFGFLYGKKLYRFTTYTGAKLTELDVTENHIRIRLEDKNYRIDINADRSEGIELPAPILGEMTAKVNESLSSNIDVALLKKKSTGTELIYSGKGRNSGLEFVGDIEELIRGLKGVKK